MKPLKQLDFSNKQYIIFDLDGTLVDSLNIWDIVDQKLIKKYSGKTIDLEIVRVDRNNFINNIIEGDTYNLYSKFLIDKYNLENIDSQQLTIERRNMVNKITETEVDFKPGVVELIKKLKNMGLTLILATMNSKSQIDVYAKKNKKMLKQMNIKEVFDFIITMEDVEKKKPNPEVFNKIAKYYDARYGECLIFEDSFTGIISAKEAYIEVINVYDKCNKEDREKIYNLTDYAILSYKEMMEYLDSLTTEQKKQIHK